MGRRKTRNRMEILEGEVAEWKAKYEAVMKKLKTLEQQGPKKNRNCVSPTFPKETQIPQSHGLVDVVECGERSIGKDDTQMQRRDSKQQQLFETILRPAVKISNTAAVTSVTPLVVSSSFVPQDPHTPKKPD